MPLDFIFDDESTDGSRPRASSSSSRTFGKGRDWFESQRGVSEHGIVCVVRLYVLLLFRKVRGRV